MVAEEFNQEEGGWVKIYHRVRIGPGKVVGFGLYEGKPVFCLPGGPPSNYMAFLNLTLPGLMKLAAYCFLELPAIPAKITSDILGQIDWTQFVQGVFERQDEKNAVPSLAYDKPLARDGSGSGRRSYPRRVRSYPGRRDRRGQSIGFFAF